MDNKDGAFLGQQAFAVGDSGIARGQTCSVVAIEGDNLKVRFSSNDIYWYDWITKKEFTKTRPEKEIVCGVVPLETKKNTVNHPAHYNTGKIEVIEYIEDKGMNFNIGNCCKYISRYKHKNNPVEDLEKAEWYLRREISKLKGENNR